MTEDAVTKDQKVEEEKKRLTIDFKAEKATLMQQIDEMKREKDSVD